MSISRADCLELDRQDPLAGFRDRFFIPDDLIYLDGNSLGALPRNTSGRITELVDQEWREHLVEGWLRDGWMDSPLRVGAKLARFLDAAEGEVVVADSTSVCLFKALTAALRLRPQRRVILSTTDNFPADLYVAQGVVDLLGERCSLRVVEPDQIDHIDSDVAVVMLTHVDYRSGYMHDMEALTARAHDAGALTVWDLCHSAGAVPVDLTTAAADFAVGCGYKYLNGGPGAPAFLHVAARHQEQVRNPISSWLGHMSPFEFRPDYDPADGIRRMISGSPSVVSIAALECGVDIWLEAGMDTARAKSIALTELFIDLVEARCGGAGFDLATPRDPARRGSQVGLRHPQGYGVIQALIQRKVVGDFRDPDICRFGFTPLYTRHVDVYDAVDRLVDVLASGEHLDTVHSVRRAIT